MKKITALFAFCLIAGSTSAHAQSSASAQVSVKATDRTVLTAPKALAPNEVFVIVGCADTTVPTRSHVARFFSGAELAQARNAASSPIKPMQQQAFKVTVTHSAKITEPAIKEGSNTSSIGK